MYDILSTVTVPRKLVFEDRTSQSVYLALAFLEGHADSVAQLADIVRLSWVTTARAVKRLQKNGYIYTEKCRSISGHHWVIEIKNDFSGITTYKPPR